MIGSIKQDLYYVHLQKKRRIGRVQRLLELCLALLHLYLTGGFGSRSKRKVSQRPGQDSNVVTEIINWESRFHRDGRTTEESCWLAFVSPFNRGFLDPQPVAALGRAHASEARKTAARWSCSTAALEAEVDMSMGKGSLSESLFSSRPLVLVLGESWKKKEASKTTGKGAYIVYSIESI